MTVRVPNERDNKGTVKVDVRLPDGVLLPVLQEGPGLEGRSSTKEKLADARRARAASRSTEQVTRVVWTGNPKRAASSGPTSSRSSRSRCACPTAAVGSQLVFRAFQTYRGGERVRWTGAPGLRDARAARDADRARGGVAASRSLEALEPEEGLARSSGRAQSSPPSRGRDRGAVRPSRGGARPSAGQLLGQPPHAGVGVGGPGRRPLRARRGRDPDLPAARRSDAALLARKQAEVRRRLTVTVDGRRRRARGRRAPRGSRIRPARAGWRRRASRSRSTAVRARGRARSSVRDGTFPGRVGWKASSRGPGAAPP